MMELFNKPENLSSPNIAESNNFDPDKRIEVNESSPDRITIGDSRDFAIGEASSIAKDIFTQDVFNEWKNMSETQRKAYLESYGDKLADVLGIDFKGISFTELCDYMYCWGYSDGSGMIYVTPALFKDPSNLVEAINTISHEMRHEFQVQAIGKPDKFHIDEKSYNEWKVARETYSLSGTSELDPFGYQYNALELDARHFGEGIISNLQRHLMGGVV